MKHYLPYCLLLALAFFSCSSEAPKDTTQEDNHLLKKMIGQMIMVGFDGKSIDDISPAFLAQIDSAYLGGLILFDYDIVKKKADRNIASPTQVKQLIADLQKRVDTPLFMAVDQEGGMVNRLKEKYGFPTSVTAKYLGDLNEVDSTRYYAARNASLLADLGFNVNFAPVVDIDLNEENPVIGKYERSYGNTAETVIKHASTWIEEHQKHKVISTLKHFPGHGSSDTDSHLDITDVTKYWQTTELEPFKVLGQLPATAIMTAHVVNHQLDSIYPATLSDKIITDLLRGELGYKGLVFSDDLQMKAVNKLYSFEQILERSLLAGVDILVFGNNLVYDETIPERAVKHILELVNKGTVSKERIRASYQRIMNYKANMML